MAKSRRKVKSVPPSVNCLLLCDDVLIGQGTQKHYLQGVIGVIGVRSIPATLGGYVAYIRLSDVHGEQKVKISLEHSSGGEPMFEFEANFPSQNNPLGIYTLVVPLPPFIVNEAGRYMFCASHSGVPIAQSPIEIIVAQSPLEEK